MKKIVIVIVVSSVPVIIAEEIVPEHNSEPHVAESFRDTSPVFNPMTSVSGTATVYAGPVNLISGENLYTYNQAT